MCFQQINAGCIKARRRNACYLLADHNGFHKILTKNVKCELTSPPFFGVTFATVGILTAQTICVRNISATGSTIAASIFDAY